MDAKISTWKGKFFQYLATLTGVFAVTAYGVNTSWTSPYLPYLTSNYSIIPTTSDDGAWCAIAPLIGCIPGALLAANLADRIGRKYSILVMAPVVFVCFIGIAFVNNIWYLFGLRLVIGITDGAVFTVLPMYIGEIAQPSERGFLSATTCIFFILGTLFINTIGVVTSIFTSSLICATIPLLHFMSFIFMPESPHYYIKIKKYKEAERSLEILRSGCSVKKEMSELCQAIARQEMVLESKFLDLIVVPCYRKGCFIFFILCSAGRLCGKMPIMFYTKTIFEESGSSIDAALSSIIYCSVELVVVTLTTFFLIDRYGRRVLVITSCALCTVMIFLLALYFYFKDFDYDIIRYLDWLPITSLISYNIAYSVGISYAHMTYVSELFPTNVKANAVCMAELTIVFVSAISSKFFQLTNDAFGTMAMPFFSFSVCSCIFLVLIVKFVPETKGKTLEEIQLFLIGKERHSKVVETKLLN